MIVTESSTTVDGKPFCIVRWEDLDGENIVQGQMSPDELREFGMRCMETAEAAETDAMMLRYFTQKIGIEIGQFGQVLIDLREFRGAARTSAGDGHPEMEA